VQPLACKKLRLTETKKTGHAQAGMAGFDVHQADQITPQAIRSPPPPNGIGMSEWLSPPA
jgi:hypothetical protein